MILINLLLIISFVIEPLIWFYGIDFKCERKYTKRLPYILHIAIIYTISSIYQFTNISELLGGLFYTVIFTTSMIFFICFCYKGKTYKKLFYVGALSILSLLSDLIIVIFFSILGMDLAQMTNGIYNALATTCSKVVFCTLTFVLNKIKININSDTAMIVIVLTIIELPSVVLFNGEKISNIFLTTYILSQIAIVLMVMYFKKTINTRKNKEDEAKQKAIELEKRVKSAIERAMELERQKEETALKLKKLEEQERVARKKAIELEQELNSKTNMIEIIENRKKIFLNIEDIIAAERVNRKVLLTTKKSKHEINKSISYLEEQLGGSFIRINQGTIINKLYIERADGESLYLKNGRTFHIPRERVKEVKEGIRKEMLE